MTNAPLPPGSGGAPPTSYPSGPSISSIPRRSSYASVASGTPAASSQSVNHPAWSGALSNLVSTTPSNSYPPPYQSDSRLHRYPSGLEAEMQANGGVGLGSGWRRATPMPSYSRRFSTTSDNGGLLHGPLSTNQFFIPSYLKNSKYLAQLAT